MRARYFARAMIAEKRGRRVKVLMWSHPTENGPFKGVKVPWDCLSEGCLPCIIFCQTVQLKYPDRHHSCKVDPYLPASAFIERSAVIWRLKPCLRSLYALFTN